MRTSFDLSAIEDLSALAEVVGVISDSMSGVAERWLIVGATARDLILHHAYKIPRFRATVDLDVGVAVRSWRAFDSLRQRLVQRGAKLNPKAAHRFVLGDWQIDVVPFGGVEHDGVIVWPASDIEMSVAGFEEASRHSLDVVLPGGIAAAVASPAGLMILKLIAWDERHRTLPRHDAADIRALIHAYGESWNEDRLYEEAGDLLEKFAYDNSLAAAALLGRDVAAIAQPTTRDLITSIVERETSTSIVLAADMGRRAEENLKLLEAFYSGFTGY